MEEIKKTEYKQELPVLNVERGGMEGSQGQELREFNRLYKRLDDLYHSLSLKMGMSDSTFMILYTIAELGDGCSQKEICEQVYVS